MFRQATRIAGIFAAFGILWILLSDRAVALLFPLAEHNQTAQTIKGVIFVLSSAVLIFALVSRMLAKQRHTELRLNSAEKELRQMAENTSDLFYTYQLLPERQFTYVSPSCLKITGYSQQEHYGDPELGFKLVHPDDRLILSEMADKIPQAPVLLRWIRKDGKIISIEQSIVGVYDESGQLAAIAGVGRDVTAAQLAKQDMELLNHAYTVLSRINRLIVRETDPESIFAEACHIPLSSGNFSLAWIGRVDRVNNTIRVAATAGDPAHLQYLQQMHITLDDTATGRGPTGMAARFGKPFWCSDIAADRLMAPWREGALAHGFRSSAAFPLKVAGEVVAVWTLYSPIPNYFSLQIHSLYNEIAGDISFSLQTIRTAKEHEQLTAEIRKSHAKYATLVEQLPVVVYIFCRTAVGDLHLEFISESVYTVFPVTREDMKATGMDFFQFIHPDEKQTFLAAFSESIARVSPMDWRGRILSNGELRYVRLHSIPQKYDNGEIRWHGIAEDETRLHEMQSQILTGNRRWETALTATGDGLLDWDIQSGSIFFSPTLSTMLGYAPEEWGTNLAAWEKRVHPDDVGRVSTLLQSHLQQRTAMFACEYRILCKNGSYNWVLDRGKAVERDTMGNPERVIRIITDISEERRQRENILENEERLNTIFTEAPLGMAIIDSEKAELLSVNPKYCEITGRTAEGLQKMTWKQITHVDDIAADQNFMDELNAGKRSNFKMQKRLIKHDGSVIWVSMTVARLTHFHEARRVHICLIEDITEIVRNEERMRLDSAVISNTRDGVVITNLEPRIVSVNRAYTEITGYTESEVVGQNPSILKSGRQDAHFYREMWQEIKSTGRWQGELYNRRKNGEVFPQVSSIDTIYDAKGNPQYYVGVFSDMAKLKKTEESFERLAHYDVLTGLPNRLMFNSRLSHAIETAKRGRHSIAVLFMDLDHFKNVNDSLGHVAGDELLNQVAQRLRRRLRAEDTIARLGGDEFLILLEDVQPPNHAAIVARDLIITLSAPFHLASGYEVYTAGSFGISLFPQDGETATDIIRNADAALYLAKSEGRNTFRFYTDELTITAKHRLRLESLLRRAIEQKELSVYYQPIVQIDSDEVIGAEALCRWITAEHGTISPAEFIPVAEETGLIVALGDFVLRTACRDAAIFHQKNPKFRTIAVNASVRQFQGIEWLELISRALETLPAGLLEIEITESTIMNKGSEAVAILQRLREIGIRVAIDDFGTGYSSLSYLQRFSVNQLKIDQSFVSEMTKNPASIQLVRTMIAMAKSLGLTTLAEGIETKEQLEILRTEGCLYYQGFLKSPGVTADRFMKEFL